MTDRDLFLLLRRRPFLPFLIHVSDGTTHDIRHPDQAVPGLSSLWIARDTPAPVGMEWEERLVVSLLHIVRLEPLSPPVPGNGAG